MVSKKKIKNNNKKTLNYKQRVSLVYLIVFCLVGLLVTRLGWLTLVKGRYLEAKANTEWQKEISVTATRGDILDRNESILVSSANVYRLDFDLDAIKTHMKKNEVTKEEIAKQISGVVSEVSYDDILKALNRKNSDGSDVLFCRIL